MKKGTNGTKPNAAIKKTMGSRADKVNNSKADSTRSKRATPVRKAAIADVKPKSQPVRRSRNTATAKQPASVPLVTHRAVVEDLRQTIADQVRFVDDYKRRLNNLVREADETDRSLKIAFAVSMALNVTAFFVGLFLGIRV